MQLALMPVKVLQKVPEGINIVRIGWRVVVLILALNYIHIQAVVQVMQVATKTALQQ